MSTTLNLFYYPTFVYEVEFRHVETDFIPKVDSVLQNMTIAQKILIVSILVWRVIRKLEKNLAHPISE